MKSISADIANTVNITLRRNDSFYLKVDLSNEDGSKYNLINPDTTSFTAFLGVYNSNDEPVLGFSTEASNSEPSTIDSSITLDSSLSTVTIEAEASDMSLFTGAYKYKLVVSGTTDVNTIMVGKVKVVDL
mgnify:FL=1